MPADRRIVEVHAAWAGGARIGVLTAVPTRGKLTFAFELDEAWLAAAPSVRLDPAPGDLLVMGGTCQRTWQHCVPKSATLAGPRISVTLRPTTLLPPDQRTRRAREVRKRAVDV